MQTSRSKPALVVTLLAITFGTGCGAMTRSVARNATPAAVESGIEEVASAKNQETIVQSIDPERVEEATEKVAAGATDGLVEAMSAPPRQERITQAMEPVVAAM